MIIDIVFEHYHTIVKSGTVTFMHHLHTHAKIQEWRLGWKGRREGRRGETVIERIEVNIKVLSFSKAPNSKYVHSPTKGTDTAAYFDAFYLPIQKGFG